MTASPIHLAAEVRGPTNKPVTVLLHSLALDRSVWEPAVAPLTDFGPVVLLDLRGHGQSPASTAFSIEDMADDVEVTLADFGLDHVALVGMSMGGCVAQAMATRHPARIRSLGLIDTTAWYGPSAAKDWAARASIAESQGMRALSEFQLTRWFSDEFRKSNPEACSELLDIFAKNEVASYVSSCRALGAFDGREGLAHLDIPTSVIVGELDEATPPVMAEDLHTRISGSSLTVIPGSKHLTAHERADQVVTAIAPIL